MPIKGLSDDLRIPRLGKIHLGYRDKERGFPVKTDYFVFPKEHSDYSTLCKLYGDYDLTQNPNGKKPKELRILIPVEDEEQWATQYYKSYNLTRGLVCKGNGETATRMVDIKTGALPTKDTQTVSMADMACTGKACPEYKAKKCGETMNLKFILPEIPGIGVWQIDTGSINSILNINSCANVIKKAFGRISLIPLILSLEPIEVNNPESGKKQTVYVLNLRTNVTLTQLADAAREQSKTLQLEAPDYEALMNEQTERDIEELWPDDGKKQTPIEVTATVKTEVVTSPQTPIDVKATAKPETDKGEQKINLADLTFKNPGDFFMACLKHLKLQKSDVEKEVPEYNIAEAGQRKKAWEYLIGVHGQQPK